MQPPSHMPAPAAKPTWSDALSDPVKRATSPSPSPPNTPPPTSPHDRGPPQDPAPVSPPTPNKHIRFFSPLSSPAISSGSVASDEPEPEPTLWRAPTPRARASRSADRASLADLPAPLRAALQPLDFDGEGTALLADIAEAAAAYARRRGGARQVGDTHTPTGTSAEAGRKEVVEEEEEEEEEEEDDDEAAALHGLIGAPNHVTLLVSDVDASTRFYTDVLGLRRLPRPALAEEGAWFGLGGLQLHLVGGTPLVHAGPEEELGLRFNHLSFETHAVQAVAPALERLGIAYRVNDVVCPEPWDDVGGGMDGDGCDVQIVRQVFFRDPDGYFIEVCNCVGEDNGPFG